MNRQIKFRGKRIDNGEWVYGNLVEKTRWDLHKDYFITWNKLTKNQNDLLTDSEYIEEQVDPDTVGQFTGLTDKNGREIYEWDIIYSEFNDGSNTNCLIGWNDEETCFGIMDDSEFKYKKKGYDFPHFDNVILNNFIKNSKRFEVISNIFDNPGLMEECEN